MCMVAKPCQARVAELISHHINVVIPLHCKFNKFQELLSQKQIFIQQTKEEYRQLQTRLQKKYQEEVHTILKMKQMIVQLGINCN